jgi:recombination associated protein RdgC
MWFKNLQIYQFTKAFSISANDLETALQQQSFRPCASILPSSIGWTAPIGYVDDAPLVHQANGMILIALNIEEKILPAAVINEQLGLKVEKLQDEQDRKLSSKEKMALKDEVYADLLPRAFSKSQKMYALLDLEKQLLLIDTASRNKAEDFIVFLRKTLDSLPVAVPETVAPGMLMTKWLKAQRAPQNFEIADACVLYDSKVDGGTIRCTKQDLLSPNITAFMQEGMEVVQLQLLWKEHLRFVLRDDFSITSLKFTDAIHDLAKDIHTENAQQEMDANFVIMCQTLNEFLEQLFSLFLKTKEL